MILDGTKVLLEPEIKKKLKLLIKEINRVKIILNTTELNEYLIKIVGKKCKFFMYINIHENSFKF